MPAKNRADSRLVPCQSPHDKLSSSQDDELDQHVQANRQGHACNALKVPGAALDLRLWAGLAIALGRLSKGFALLKDKLAARRRL